MGSVTSIDHEECTVAFRATTDGSAHELPFYAFALETGFCLCCEGVFAQVGAVAVRNEKSVEITPTESGRERGHWSTEDGCFAAGGSKLDADLFIPATGVGANTWFVNVSLPAEDRWAWASASTLRGERAGPEPTLQEWGGGLFEACNAQ
ncbi:hypothetical protein N7468_000543 [Penicillium chermesinum]|uniref:Uncharacterized protein n=1 Tax=Penicillium chermesinum TaxID=63820 RepID=A0A9W9PKI6_9EURO|nr:uncharacterized protein N7468_000543 [Penicillium chermesinum]KAJ5249092.1 hypothetical protein N7468_000543 [Penicillium chermesinum]